MRFPNFDPSTLGNLLKIKALFKVALKSRTATKKGSNHEPPTTALPLRLLLTLPTFLYNRLRRNIPPGPRILEIESARYRIYINNFPRKI